MDIYEITSNGCKIQKLQKFDENKFCHDLDQILTKENLCNAKDPYDKLTNIYNTLEKHAPLKSKIVRVNQTPFMDNELSKAMEKSRLRNRHLKYPSREKLFILQEY